MTSYTDITKTWTGDEARRLAQLLWPGEKWTASVDLIELMGDGEYVINADPFTKIPCSKCDTMPKYDKLIRDKIPQIIESEGKRCGVEVMEYTEFAKYPKKKLQEEVDDFMESDEIDELVEIFSTVVGINLCSK